MKTWVNWAIAATAVVALGLGVLVVVVAQAWDSGGVVPGYTVERDPAFDQALRDSYTGRKPVRFDDLTDFEWTTVTVINEDTDEDFVEGLTGVRLVEGFYRDRRNLLVFCDRGTVVHLIETDYLPSSIGYSFTSEARIDDALGDNTWTLNGPGGWDVEADCT